MVLWLQVLFLCVLHLEMGLREDAGELSCSVRAALEGVEISEDLLQKLHIVLSHR